MLPLLLAGALVAQARPAVLIFGGGWGPEGTQASMEAQVHDLATVLADRKPVLLFGSGDAQARSVQVSREKRAEVDEILGLVFDQPNHLGVSYRPTQLAGAGAASRAAFLEALDRSRHQAAGVVVFGVGHGTQATETDPAALELWGPDDRLYADDLARHLDESGRDGPVALVLGHCYSGGFVDFVHAGADPSARLAEPARCVLAAVPPELMASGCTPEAADPTARSFIALMAEALARKESDYDGNGRVSLHEAQSYARIHDRTIDVPVRSSALWLRRRAGERRGAAGPRYPRLLALARPADRAVLEALAPAGPDPLAAGVRAEAELSRLKGQLQQELQALEESFDRSRRVLLDKVLALWPELANPYHEVSRRLLAGDAPEVAGFIRANPELRDLRALEIILGEKAGALQAVEERWARARRWLDAVTAVADEDGFRRRARRRDAAALDRMQACEALEP